MKFMASWSTSADHKKSANARFLETGGRPPAGVKMLGRWHSPAGGFCLSETEDVKALYVWLSQWSDLLDFSVTPVIEDADVAEIAKKIGS